MKKLMGGIYIDPTVKKVGGNFNNITYTTDSLQTIKDSTEEPDENLYLRAVAPSFGETSSLGQKEASSDAKGVLEHGPRPWRYLKADLFDNANNLELAQNKRKFRVNLAFLVEGESEFRRVSAQLNSAFRYALSQLNSDVKEEHEHKECLRELYQKVNANTDFIVRASKCYQKSALQGKGTTLKGLSVVLEPLTAMNEYRLWIIVKTDIYSMTLTGQKLTPKQRAVNMIASGEDGKIVNAHTSVDDFFKLGANK